MIGMLTIATVDSDGAAWMLVAAIGVRFGIECTVRRSGDDVVVSTSGMNEDIAEKVVAFADGFVAGRAK